jgi:hypothetical protein
MTTTEWSLSIYQDFMLRAYMFGPQTDLITDEGKTVYPPKVPYEEAKKYFSTANNSAFTTVPGTVKGGKISKIAGYDNASEDVVNYWVWRFSDFDPDLGPATGTGVVLADDVQILEYQDDAFAGLPMGWYAYAVQVEYSTGLISPPVFSNIVGRDMDAMITWEITLCDGNDPEDVEITMSGMDYPYAEYFGVTDVTGIYTFDQVWKMV